jgi:hypothetical protein
LDPDIDRMNCPCKVPTDGGRTAYCERRQVEMPAHFVLLCQTDERYRTLLSEEWTPHASSRGPGDTIAKVTQVRGSPRLQTGPGQDASAQSGSNPKPPPLSRQAWNLAASLAAFVADGLRTVDEQQYRQRLEICDVCDQRRGNRCMKCGCRLSLKARGRAFKCPEDKWPEL